MSDTILMQDVIDAIAGERLIDATNNMTGMHRNVDAQLLETKQELEAAEQKLQDFRQEVSDAVSDYFQYEDNAARKRLYGFIIPAPKPDPLVVLCEHIGLGYTETEDMVNELRAALEALGLEIRSKNDD